MRQRAAIFAGFIIGPGLLAFGILWLLAFVPGIGVGGSVTTTDCGTGLPRHGPTCWGDFTPYDGGLPRPVTIDGVDEEDVTVSAVTYPWAPSQAFRPPGVSTAIGSTAWAFGGAAVLTVTITRLVRTIRPTRRRNRFAPAG
ncbi:hypothetical protein [Dactylosporangium sp. NPDC049140]|uniref:hypothetical protein n=1 Tax=Dactylosporangium sp. NPDC049140 TaxID=3155647 RepID=UPI0033CFD8D8